MTYNVKFRSCRSLWCAALIFLLFLGQAHAQENASADNPPSRVARISMWHLGIDYEQDKNTTQRRYKFPYGDFKKVHRCGVLTAESGAGQYKHFDIENAAAHLHGMIDVTEHEHKAAD